MLIARIVVHRYYYLFFFKLHFFFDFILQFMRTWISEESKESATTSTEIWEKPIVVETERTVDEDIDDFLDDLFQWIHSPERRT